MSGGIFAIVLLAALLHALWNAAVKAGADKAVSMAAVVIGQGASGLIALTLAPMPDWSCWPWLAGGVALHLGYQWFLVAAYRQGDLTQVYPIARGVSPLLVAGASVILFGVTFSSVEWLAIAMIAIGVASISLARRADGLFQVKGAVLALVTGAFIASYSIVDGTGARIAGTSLGFFGWLAFLNALAFVALAAPLRPTLLRGAFRQGPVLIFGGGASFVAYALVVFAFTQAPIALVTALRETSIVFALLIGVGVLKERLDLLKVAATALTLGGAALLRFARS